MSGAVSSTLQPYPSQLATHQDATMPQRVAACTPKEATRWQVELQLGSTKLRLRNAKKHRTGGKGGNFFKNYSLWNGIKAYRENNRDKLPHLPPRRPVWGAA